MEEGLGAMSNPSLRLVLRSVLLFSCLSWVVACGGSPPRRADGGDGGMADAMEGDGGGMDAGTSDGGGTDGSMMPSADGCGDVAVPPRVTDCGADLAPVEDGGVCRLVPDSGEGLLLVGTVLTPGEAFVGGQLLVGADGRIACVGCDCETGAVGAPRVECPGAAISAGFVNAHDHVTFGNTPPYEPTAERYEHRHDWRRGARGHTRISARASGLGSGGRAQTAWAELRQLLGGTTSINGSGAADGLLRNLDRAGSREGLASGPVEYATFPLDDSRGTQRDGDCDYGAGRDTSLDVLAGPAYSPHLAEGIDGVASNEIACARSGRDDLLLDRTAVIHGIGLTTEQIRELATDGVGLIWSPRSNTTLYGETARVPLYMRLGVRVALGTDWTRTGSIHMLRELKCAQRWAETYWGGMPTPYQLWRMATVDAAAVLGFEGEIGALQVGAWADVAVFAGAGGEGDPYRGVVESEERDVALVLRGGEPLYGESSVLEGLGRGDCEALDVCGASRRVCVRRDHGTSLADLMAANTDSYGLVFCGAPDDEPSCIPVRAADPTEFPDPSVDGSSVYTGLSSPSDRDGDGVEDAADNCPDVFNPVRPLDEGAQPDTDGDGLGDVCDPSPLGDDVEGCALRDPRDGDGDGVPDAMDVCPEVDDTDQADADGDGDGDACDLCPVGTMGADGRCEVTVYDIKRGDVPDGTPVSLSGLVVTAVADIGAFLQVPQAHPSYAGADWSGVFVYTRSRPPVAVGDEVSVSGQTNDFYGQRQIARASLSVTGTAVVPSPVSATVAELSTGGSRADALEGVLVQVSGTSLTVTGIVDDASAGPGDRAPYNEFVVEGVLRVDDFLYLIDPQPSVGDTFSSLRGVLAWRNGNSKLLPRSAADVSP